LFEANDPPPKRRRRQGPSALGFGELGLPASYLPDPSLLTTDRRFDRSDDVGLDRHGCDPDRERSPGSAAASHAEEFPPE
jgi:hypothetical protein